MSQVAAHMPGVTITAAGWAGTAADPPARPEITAAETDLPAILGNGRFGRGEIDRRAAVVAVAARDGPVSVQHARRVVAALLYG